MMRLAKRRCEESTRGSARSLQLVATRLGANLCRYLLYQQRNHFPKHRMLLLLRASTHAMVRLWTLEERQEECTA